MNKRFSASMRLSVGLLAVCLGMSFSACHRPVATFQRSTREVFYSPGKPETPDQATPPETPDVPTPPTDEPRPVAYADARPDRPQESMSERISRHQQRAQRLPVSARPLPVAAASSEKPVSSDGPAPRPDADYAVQPGPKKQRKTLREWLGLPPRKKLNWWQRIPWQLKASVVVILIAVAFAILNITLLAIVFGLIGAFLLIRGLKKSFKVRRGLFGIFG